MTSLQFMLLWVPLPVCHTARGKCPRRDPSRISRQTVWMISARSRSSLPRAQLAAAQAALRWAKARMRSAGIFSVPMGKFSRLRWVWAPQYLSAGTLTSPMVSCSMRYSKGSFLLLRDQASPYHRKCHRVDCHSPSATSPMVPEAVSLRTRSGQKA